MSPILLKTCSGKLTVTDISRKLNMSKVNVSRIIKPLIESGEIVVTKAEKGNRVFLSPCPDL